VTIIIWIFIIGESIILKTNANAEMGPCELRKKKDALEERTTLFLAFLFPPFFLITRLNPKSYPDKSRAWSSTQRTGFNWTEKKSFRHRLPIHET